MPASFTENLRLAMFSSAEDGWAAAMNSNLKKIDTKLSDELDQTKNRIAEVEQQIADRYTDLETSLQTQTSAYINNVSDAQQSTYQQLTQYFETILQPTLESFLSDMNDLIDEIKAQITTTETSRQNAITSISDLSDTIESEFSAVNAQIQAEKVGVDARKEVLENLLNAIKTTLDNHIDNLSNPHEVTADQIGELGDIVKYQQHNEDAAFL